MVPVQDMSLILKEKKAKVLHWTGRIRGRFVKNTLPVQHKSLILRKNKLKVLTLDR